MSAVPGSREITTQDPPDVPPPGPLASSRRGQAVEPVQRREDAGLVAGALVAGRELADNELKLRIRRLDQPGTGVRAPGERAHCPHRRVRAGQPRGLLDGGGRPGQIAHGTSVGERAPGNGHAVR
jgi:hypothetical protein